MGEGMNMKIKIPRGRRKLPDELKRKTAHVISIPCEEETYQKWNRYKDTVKLRNSEAALLRLLEGIGRNLL